MAVDKRSISLDPALAAEVERAAREEGVSFSEWLGRAAAHRLRISEGLAGVAAWEADHGALTGTERAAAETIIDGVVARGGAPRSPSPPAKARRVRKAS